MLAVVFIGSNYLDVFTEKDCENDKCDEDEDQTQLGSAKSQDCQNENYIFTCLARSQLKLCGIFFAAA